MAGLMQGELRGERVKVESSAAVPLDSILKDGVRGSVDVDALAVRSDREVSVMAWNYHDDDVQAREANVRLVISGVPGGRVLLRHYRIDQTHSNAYRVWKEMGSPQSPTPQQYARLVSSGAMYLVHYLVVCAVAEEARGI